MTHMTAATRFIEAAGVRLAFRRCGAAGGTPLVMLQHFRGNLDNWDPALTDALAREREVILVDYPGVGASGGASGPTIADTARQKIPFISALELAEVDLLGFSIGGFVAQVRASTRPAMVRRLILAATGPKGARGMHGWREDIEAAASSSGASWPALRSATSRAAWPRATPSTTRSSNGHSRSRGVQRLTGIRPPMLIIQGDGDQMIPTKLSH
jgi:pimeloyl-ACP methyl ester carboxylesterase